MTMKWDGMGSKMRRVLPNLKRRRVLIGLSICVFFVCILAVYSKLSKPKISSASAILIDIDSEKVLFEKEPDERLRPASTTKVMLLFIVFDKLASGEININKEIYISERAVKVNASQAGLFSGEKIKLHDILKCIILSSGSEAAIAVAEHISGSEADFVTLMNKKADELSLQNTHFRNAVGLDDDNHYSSARDLAKTTIEFIKVHPEILAYTCIREDIITHENGKELFLSNTNDLLAFEGVFGFKTGSSNLAGSNLIATAKVHDNHYIAVTLKANSEQERRSDMIKLLKLKVPYEK